MRFDQVLIEGSAFAFKSLRAHRLRTLLTMLGMSIGIFTITLVYTLVDSLEYSITKNLAGLGSNVLFVHNFPWADSGEDWVTYMNRPLVSYNDFKVLKSELSHADAVAFEASVGNQVIKYKGRSVSPVEVKAITEDYIRINDLKMFSGRYFSGIEMKSGRAVCILGYNVAMELFGSADCIGRDIRFRGRKIRVIGVVEKQGAPFFGQSLDDRLFVPYVYVSRVFNINSRSIQKVISVKADRYENLDLVEQETIGLVRKARGLRPTVEDNFSINKQEMLMNTAGVIFDKIGQAGFIIGVFSLLVGGVGIAIIMYTAVKERTFEIGLQKSMGATKLYILFQFLLEAVLICMIGAGIGIFFLTLVVLIAPYGLKRMDVQMEILLTVENILWGCLWAFLIGIASGFVPAFLASRLNPVNAMRAK